MASSKKRPGSADLDPGAHGDFRISAVPRFQNCAQCGAALEWYLEHSDTGQEAPPVFEEAGAECDCGLWYRYRPNLPHLRQKRRHTAAMRHQDETEAGQRRLL